MRFRESYSRNDHGQALSVMGVMLAVLIIGTLGLVAFEFARYILTRDQLRTATDAAALAAAASIAGSDFDTPASAKDNARTTATAIFRMNVVLGASLAEAAVSADNPPAPQSANQAAISFQFIDRDGNTGSDSDPDLRTARVSAAFGYVPMAADMLGMAGVVLPIVVSSDGGVPSLDLIVCVDVSRSIDDQTLVTAVKRRWDPNANGADGTPGTIDYQEISAPFPHDIYHLVNSTSPFGANIDGAYPQFLDDGPPYNTRLTFDGALRGSPNQGSPPGNHPSTVDGTSATTFTDLVVNIDGQDTFGGLTIDSFNFPDYRVLVEAARGNLENDGVYTSSQAKKTFGATITPQSGYQQAYQDRAKAMLQPLQEAKDAIANFLTVMNINANTHVALIPFASTIGTDADTVVALNNITFSSYLDAGDPHQFPLPLISLNKTDPRVDDALDAIPKLLPLGSTNIGDSLKKAVDDLIDSTKTRPDATRAIVLFTDGQPTSGGSDPQQYAFDEAQRAHDNNIRIFTIGLSQIPEMEAGQLAVLGDDRNGSGHGIAAIAGNGGTFTLVTDRSQLKAVFLDVARALTNLLR